MQEVNLLLSFMAGAMFTLAIGVLCLRILFWVGEVREDREVLKEQRRKKITREHASEGAVIQPKTWKERESEKDETLKAFKEVIS